MAVGSTRQPKARSCPKARSLFIHAEAAPAEAPAIVKQARAEVDRRLLQERDMPSDQPVTFEELMPTL